MAYVFFIIYGFIAGVLAKMVLPSYSDKGGVVLTSVLGICGSVVGGHLFSFFGYPMPKSLSLMGLVPAVVGAFILILVWQFFISKVFSK